MASFVPALSIAADIDSPDWRGRATADEQQCAWDQAHQAPDTVRSVGVPRSPTMRVGLFAEAESMTVSGFADSDEEPPTLRHGEIGAVAPRASRSFDPADYVIEAPSPRASGFHPASAQIAPTATGGPHGASTDEPSGIKPHDEPVPAMRSRLGGFVHKLGGVVERIVA